MVSAPPGISLRAEALGAHLPPLVVQAERVAATVMQGVHGRRRAGTGDSFWQFRPYLAGDAASRVDWRQSAKADRLYVRETEWEAAQTVVLWRDGGARMDWRSHLADVTKRERASLLLLALAALLLWRRMLAASDKVPPLAGTIAGNEGMVALAALAFAAVNGAWLRTAHHWLDVAYDPVSLGASPVVQTGLAIIWTLLAMGLMLFAARKVLRAVWIAGAALLGLVVLKLLVVDMSSAEGWQRIVTFIGVGVLMLVIGYFVPLPPRRAEDAPSREAHENPA